jgi:hypothetical protein
MAIFNNSGKIGTKYLNPNPVGEKILGSFGKLLTGVGTYFNAPQILPGGLGAQLQSIAGYMKKMNPINPPPVGAYDVSLFGIVILICGTLI